jgi:hypothetical protein
MSRRISMDWAIGRIFWQAVISTWPDGRPQQKLTGSDPAWQKADATATGLLAAMDEFDRDKVQWFQADTHIKWGRSERRVLFRKMTRDGTPIPMPPLTLTNHRLRKPRSGSQQLNDGTVLTWTEVPAQRD